MKGVFLVVILLLFVSCENLLVNDEPVNTQEENFDLFWDDFNLNYAGFSARGIQWQEIKVDSESRINSRLSNQEFFELLSEITLGLEDIHVELRGVGRQVHFDSSNPLSVNQIASLDGYLNDVTDINEAISYGFVEGSNIGYISINTFSSRFPVSVFRKIDEAVAAISDTDGLILDIRSNSGGAAANFKTAASRFVNDSFTYASAQLRNGPESNDFADPIGDKIAPEGPLQYTKPIILLTNRKSASAAEIFAMTLKDLTYVTIVGDTTAGGFGNSVWRELPNGWSYRMTITLISDKNGVSYEGIGIPPDEVIYISRQDSIDNRDPQIERAIELLK
ncbi:MAG: S41 family peptidase [Bacteroidota bacterium]